MNKKIKCEICGKEYKAISRTHLQKHGMTMEEYSKKYPNSPMRSEQTKRLLSTNREEYWVAKHGEEEGKQKYEQYKKFLAEKNTLSFKKEKYGWTEEDFRKFNKSRAVTRENMIKKHGTVEGNKIYEDYVEKQRKVGISKEYFIEKLGKVEGMKKYKELSKQKAHTMETYIKRYGNKKIAEEKLKEFFSKIESDTFSSKLEREFITGVDKKLREKNIHFEKIYSILHNNQYGFWSSRLEKLIKCDLVILDVGACIEFNGNYWHCNPEMYTENFVHPKLGLTAKEIWTKDREKELDIVDSGLKLKTVWEKDYQENKNKTIHKIVEWICKLNDQR